MGVKDFEVLNRLGEGSFSSVWKVRRFSDGKEYAMKKVKMSALSDKEKQNALNEVRILASIRSPYIIRYKEAFFDDESMTLCIIMECAAAGDLYNLIHLRTKSHAHFTEQEIWQAFVQVLKGLKVLHDHKILHRDLKCANVFLGSDGIAKLGDLNVSKVAKNNLAYTQAGTPYYASPEIWSDQPYDVKSDIWSLGCVIYEMAALKPPFMANDLQGLYTKIQKGTIDRIPSQYSPGLFNILSWCLQKSPKSRPSCDQLLSSPLILKQLKEDHLTLSTEASSLKLLGTIRIPKNMRALSNRLPKADYIEPEERLSELSACSLDKRRNSLNGKSSVSGSKEQALLSDRKKCKTPTENLRAPQGRLPPIVLNGKNRLVYDPRNYFNKEAIDQPSDQKNEKEIENSFKMQRKPNPNLENHGIIYPRNVKEKTAPKSQESNPLLGALIPIYKVILHQKKSPQNPKNVRENSIGLARHQSAEIQPRGKLSSQKNNDQRSRIQPVRPQRPLSNRPAKNNDQAEELRDKASLNLDKPSLLKAIMDKVPMIGHMNHGIYLENGSSAVANAIAQRNHIIATESQHQIHYKVGVVRPICWD